MAGIVATTVLLKHHNRPSSSPSIAFSSSDPPRTHQTLACRTTYNQPQRHNSKMQFFAAISFLALAGLGFASPAEQQQKRATCATCAQGCLRTDTGDCYPNWPQSTCEIYRGAGSGAHKYARRQGSRVVESAVILSIGWLAISRIHEAEGQCRIYAYVIAFVTLNGAFLCEIPRSASAARFLGGPIVRQSFAPVLDRERRNSSAQSGCTGEIDSAVTQTRVYADRTIADFILANSASVVEQWARVYHTRRQSECRCQRQASAQV
ncbi:hypothetical protein VFPFJ_10746 [Purpureocillium lilacinum]|uniref:Uncharacterized protein n=1 Tax=Purpureocillium lilacinum TaxID=33203 RepID=A0A179GD57_PURLI|nr:hypothetical protein VFPFJ_10746 [Purpureocillium lilacinum]OAQ75756.1 hypothetical protein VFPFJ_10746 [Purpureocillium lilacinum]